MKKPALEVNEAVFQEQVIQLAHVYGWKVAHFRGVRIQRANGSTYYQTPVQADGKGFPDLVLARGEHVIFAEVKSEKGRLAPEQQEWLDALAGGADVYVWRPSDWDEIEGVLKGGMNNG